MGSAVGIQVLAHRPVSNVGPLEVVQTKKFSSTQEFQAELSLAVLESPLRVWHFCACVSYIAEMRSQVPGATLLKTQEDLQIGIPEMQRICICSVGWNMVKSKYKFVNDSI